MQDKVTKAYVISGAPTAESKLAKDGVTRTPSSAKITVTTAGKSSRTYLVNLTVLPLDPWAVGTFNGGGEACQATLTVAKTGKTRGKLLAADGTWTLSATSFDTRTEDGVYTLEVPEGFFLDGSGQALPAVTFTWTIAEGDGIQSIKADSKQAVYTLDGRKANASQRGIIIKGGKKVLVK